MSTMGAVVSDNDGSAFITKAEFDSLKNDFQAQIDQYNTSIDSKIDGAIASYLAGIKSSVELDEKITTNALYTIGFYTYPQWFIDCVGVDGVFRSNTTSRGVWSQVLPGARSDELGFNSYSAVVETQRTFSPHNFGGEDITTLYTTTFSVGLMATRTDANTTGLYNNNNAWLWGVKYSTIASNFLLSTNGAWGSNNTSTGALARRITGIETNIGQLEHVLCDACPGHTILNRPPYSVFFNSALGFYSLHTTISTKSRQLTFGYVDQQSPILWGYSASCYVNSGGGWSISYTYASLRGWSESTNAQIYFNGFMGGTSTKVYKSTNLLVSNIAYDDYASDYVVFGDYNGGEFKSPTGKYIQSAIFCTPQNSRYIHAVEAGYSSTFFSSVRGNTQNVTYTEGVFKLKRIGTIYANSVANTAWSNVTAGITNLSTMPVAYNSARLAAFGYTTILTFNNFKNYVLATNGIDAGMTDGVPLFVATYTGTTHIQLETDFYARKISMSRAPMIGPYDSLARENFAINLYKDNSSDYLNGVRLNLKVGKFGNVTGNGNTLHLATSDGNEEASYAQNLVPNVTGSPGVFDYYIKVKQGDEIWIRLDPGEWTWGQDCAKVRSVKLKTFSEK